jgi:mono/diheme cytochrome c family protein
MEIGAGAILLTLGLLALLGVMGAYAVGVGEKAHRPDAPVPTGNPAMERKVIVCLGMMIVTLLVLGAYGLAEDRRAARALERQEHKSIERGIELYAHNCYTCHGLDGRGAVVPDTNPPRVAPSVNRPDFMKHDPEGAKEAYNLVYKTVQRGRTGTPMVAWSKEEGGPFLPEQVHEVTLMITKGDEMIKLGGKEMTVWEAVRETSRKTVAGGGAAPKAPEFTVPNCEGECKEGKDLWEKKGACIGCHAIGGIGGATGPNLTQVGAIAATRRPGMTAEAYLTESIRQPTAFVVQGFPPIMPAYDPALLSDEEVRKIVLFMAQLK